MLLYEGIYSLEVGLKNKKNIVLLYQEQMLIQLSLKLIWTCYRSLDLI